MQALGRMQANSLRYLLPVCQVINWFSDEENTIRYMAGYVPFMLIKVYEKKDTQDDGDILDCLSAIAVSGPVDDFYAYTHEWTKSVNRGGPFEVSTTTSTFF